MDMREAIEICEAYGRRRSLDLLGACQQMKDQYWALPAEEQAAITLFIRAGRQMFAPVEV